MTPEGKIRWCGLFNISTPKIFKKENKFPKEVSLERRDIFKASEKLTTRFTEPIIKVHSK